MITKQTVVGYYISEHEQYTVIRTINKYIYRGNTTHISEHTLTCPVMKDEVVHRI